MQARLYERNICMTITNVQAILSITIHRGEIETWPCIAFFCVVHQWLHVGVDPCNCPHRRDIVYTVFTSP